MTIKKLAQEIAAEILTVYGPDGPAECTRAQMMLGQYGKEKNMGGRNKDSIAEVIENKLRRRLEG